MRQTLNRVDSLKFIAAILVVVIHSAAYLGAAEYGGFSNYGWYNPILELAVPFFFATSGYLLANASPRKLINYAYKTFVLFLGASVLLVVAEITLIGVTSAFGKTNFVAAVQDLTQGWTIQSAVKGNFAKYHLWYLLASVIASLIVAVLRKNMVRNTSILAMASVAYLALHTGFVDFSTITAGGGFIRALFYISLGMVLYEYSAKSDRAALSSFVVFTGAIWVLMNLGNVGFWRLFLVGSIASLLLWATRIPDRPNWLSEAGPYALSIYILHPVFLTYTRQFLVLGGVDMDQLERQWWAYLALRVAIAVAGSMLLHRLFTVHYMGHFGRLISGEWIVKKQLDLGPLQQSSGK